MRNVLAQNRGTPWIILNYLQRKFHSGGKSEIFDGGCNCVVGTFCMLASAQFVLNGFEYAWLQNWDEYSLSDVTALTAILLSAGWMYKKLGSQTQSRDYVSKNRGQIKWSTIQQFRGKDQSSLIFSLSSLSLHVTFWILILIISKILISFSSSPQRFLWWHV